MSVALLMFNLDDNEGILRNIRLLGSAVDEIAIVDSSSPERSEVLSRQVEESGGKLYRVLPLGFVDPLRPFGLTKVQSEHVFILDADEEATESLKSHLRKLTARDAYVVPRFEAELRSYTHHMRVFRRRAVHYRHRSFDFPEVDGSIGWLAKTHRIIHHAHYRNYFLDKERAERYSTIENIERPFTRRYLREATTFRLRNRSISLRGAPPSRNGPAFLLSPPMIRAAIGMEFLRDLAVGKGISAASFGRRYSQAKWQFFRDLSKPARDELIAIAQDVDRYGGLFGYLGLNDRSYVERLTAGFRWDLRGIDVYTNLLRYRHRHGRPAESVYPTEEEPGFGRDSA